MPGGAPDIRHILNPTIFDLSSRSVFEDEKDELKEKIKYSLTILGVNTIKGLDTDTLGASALLLVAEIQQCQRLIDSFTQSSKELSSLYPTEDEVKKNPKIAIALWKQELNINGYSTIYPRKVQHIDRYLGWLTTPGFEEIDAVNHIIMALKTHATFLACHCVDNAYDAEESLDLVSGI